MVTTELQYGLMLTLKACQLYAFLETQHINYSKEMLRKTYQKVIHIAYEVIRLKVYTSWAIGYLMANWSEFFPLHLPKDSSISSNASMANFPY